MSLARLDDGRAADEPAPATLAQWDADEHALARCDADEHALARCDADEHALARCDASATPAELEQDRMERQRYKVQFEPSEEYVEFVERAKALVSHRGPRPDLGDLHLHLRARARPRG
jgi:hypothetical protein